MRSQATRGKWKRKEFSRDCNQRLRGVLWCNGQPGRVSTVQSPREVHTCSLRELRFAAKEEESDAVGVKENCRELERT
ncbi:hypothetical protein DMENIID0001_141230 [Sergentomyia squamirostris]